ncbi:hypothetical protein OPT61_g6872 [Boeremia exigua]|uniref:Uncharacterized protein n=1 Tax=Boeremia exigua TaxID=749465 RepID=A0ACC2I5M7_9PLEO|nr:hypothetical protein OPT61_g6872 [Boeremia exigua]
MRRLVDSGANEATISEAERHWRLTQAENACLTPGELLVDLMDARERIWELENGEDRAMRAQGVMEGLLRREDVALEFEEMDGEVTQGRSPGSLAGGEVLAEDRPGDDFYDMRPVEEGEVLGGEVAEDARRGSDSESGGWSPDMIQAVVHMPFAR